MALWLLDTNVLLRSVHAESSQHGVAVDAIAALLNLNHEIVLVGQVLFEFWSVATRPVDVNGLSWDPEEAADEVAGFTERFRLLPDPPNIFATWLPFASKYGVRGRRVHDLRLVAAIVELGIDHLLSFNDAHFRGFTGVSVFHPQELLKGAVP